MASQNMTTRIFDPAAIDFERPGKHLYEVAFSQDGVVDYVMVPVMVINGARGAGKRLLCNGGTHGNEYEGQVAVRRLMLELDAAELSGRVILIPHLNFPACDAGHRESPLDGGNMNRAFPGDRRGKVTARIADFMTRFILPQVDIVLDLHSAGSDLEHLLITSFHMIEDPAQRDEIIKVASLFDPPMLLAYSSTLSSGLLTQQAEKMGKITIGGEFGYLEGVVREGALHAYEGARNVMRYYGLMAGEIVKIAADRPTPPVLTRWLSGEDTVSAPYSGIFQTLLPVGERVTRGQLLGWLYDIEQVERAPQAIEAPCDGLLMAQSFRARVRKGATIAIIVTEITPDQMVEARKD